MSPRPPIIAIVLEDIIMERKRQQEFYPNQSRSPAEWLAILMGEVGEVADEVTKMTVYDQARSIDKYWEEMVQVAAVAVGALESMYFRQRTHEERSKRRESEKH
jgi:NTP pyrophosphatase (non-canonical NTP hydrolase)